MLAGVVVRTVVVADGWVVALLARWGCVVVCYRTSRSTARARAPPVQEALGEVVAAYCTLEQY